MMSMHIDIVPNRNSRPAVLLRESFREGSRVKKRTLANLSDWAPARIEALREVLRGADFAVRGPEAAFDVVRSRPHGHVAAVLGAIAKLKLAELFGPRDRMRDLCVALVAARLLAPGSKLSLARGLQAQTQESTLGEQLGLSSADEDDLYRAMDQLLTQQSRIEDALAARHLKDGTLVLYDVSSTYFEGRKCPLAKIGYSRDQLRGSLQIVFGLLTDAEGCPIAIEVFEGNTADPKTVSAQVKKLRERFKLQQVVLVGDRGMITGARIEEDLKAVEGIDWITSLRAPAIAELVASGTLQLDFFDQRDLAEIKSPDFPGERLIACKNPRLAAERTRKRIELLAATEVELKKIEDATARPKRPLRGKDKIGVRVGKVLGRHKVGKHFKLTITDQSFAYARDEKAIIEEAALDGIYVVRTSVKADRLGAAEVVRSYKRLSVVERAFRSMKTVDLQVRPIYHYKADRVRAHVFICMLAYYLEWHMRRALAPLLFDDDDRREAENSRASVVAAAQRSRHAESKAHRKRTDQGWPVHSFQSLLKNLATIVKNRVQPKIAGTAAFDLTTQPTPLQRRATELLTQKM
jgi:transposase